MQQITQLSDFSALIVLKAAKFVTLHNNVPINISVHLAQYFVFVEGPVVGWWIEYFCDRFLFCPSSCR